MADNQYGNQIWFVQKPLWVSRAVSAKAGALFDAIAYHAVSNEDDECWPGKWTLALAIGVDPRSITNLLFELEYVGAILVWHEPTPRGRRNRYKLAITERPFGESLRTYKRRTAWERSEARLLKQQAIADENRRWLEDLCQAEREGRKLTRRDWNASKQGNVGSDGHGNAWNASKQGNVGSDGHGNAGSSRVGNHGSVELEPLEQEPVERDVSSHTFGVDFVLPESEFPIQEQEPQFPMPEVEF